MANGSEHVNGGDAASGRPRYRRVLLKLSGEALAGGSTRTKGLGITPGHLGETARALIDAQAATGAELVVVPGGGNIVRGSELAAEGLIHRTTADHMGMLGTVINALALQGALEHLGHRAYVMSALPVEPLASSFDRRVAINALEKGQIVIVAAGVGQPYFTTDSGAALRATELACDAICKATKVDGVYTADPVKDPTATRYDSLSIREAIDKRLRVMDIAALAMCQEHGIDIAVCDFDTPGTLKRLLSGDRVGTVIHAREAETV